ncbi:hypothetical protein ACHQM5_020082 [Ranunculus cassubicifolius]
MLQFLVCFLLFIIPTLFLFITRKLSSPTISEFPRSYPIVGSAFALLRNREKFNQWFTYILGNSPNQTYVIHGALGRSFFSSTLTDFIGTGIFNSDGETWKFQRQISSHEFNTKSLRKFVETVVEAELNDRLIPILSSAAANNTVLDLQDILQRFAFDNICKIAFEFDPEYLSPSIRPQADFAVAFEDAVRISSERFGYPLPWVWKLKRILNIGSEKRLKQSISKVREFAKSIVRKKKQELNEKPFFEVTDLLSRILSSGHSDDDFVIDMVISFIVAGRDTTSAALTWFFWLVSCNPHLTLSAYDEVKDMVYTRAALSESMRLYPSVPSDTKEAAEDDVLPDGTDVKKGMRVTYHPYSGRVKRDEIDGKLSFSGRDPYTYPVFQAGPRICLGKDMAFLQMKRLVAGVLGWFRVVPAKEGFQSVFLSYLTSKMKDGLPVRIEVRGDSVIKLCNDHIYCVAILFSFFFCV